jgi:hypothetical protein
MDVDNAVRQILDLQAQITDSVQFDEHCLTRLGLDFIAHAEEALVAAGGKPFKEALEAIQVVRDGASPARCRQAEERARAAANSRSDSTDDKRRARDSAMHYHCEAAAAVAKLAGGALPLLPPKVQTDVFIPSASTGLSVVAMHCSFVLCCIPRLSGGEGDKNAENGETTWQISHVLQVIDDACQCLITTGAASGTRLRPSLLASRLSNGAV